MQKRNINLNQKPGFTLIEILVVIGLIAVLAAIVIIAVNPARQFALGRDTQRNSNLNAILNAVSQRMADNKGVFAGAFNINGTDYVCGELSATSTSITSAMAADKSEVGGNLGCLTPTYIQALPIDPGGTYAAPATGYSIYKETNTGRIHVIATETEPNIPRESILEIIR